MTKEICHYCHERRFFACHGQRDADRCATRMTYSYWLRDAKRVLEQRDVLDAVRDAEALADWARQRADAAFDEATLEAIHGASLGQEVEIERRRRGKV